MFHHSAAYLLSGVVGTGAPAGGAGDFAGGWAGAGVGVVAGFSILGAFSVTRGLLVSLAGRSMKMKASAPATARAMMNKPQPLLASS